MCSLFFVIVAIKEMKYGVIAFPCPRLELFSPSKLHPFSSLFIFPSSFQSQLGVVNNELSHQRGAIDAQQAQRQAQNEELKALHSEVAALTAILAAVKEDK